MNLREALIKQSPSLALQRAAADEIALLDTGIESLNSVITGLENVIMKKNQEIKELEKELREAYSSIDYYRNRDFPETRY